MQWLLFFSFVLFWGEARSVSDLEHILGEATKEAFALHYGLNFEPLLYNWIDRVGRKLSQSANVKVDFYILDTDEINAYATLGNLVFLTKGLLKIVETEDEIACVLAHEVAHIKLRHPQKQSGVIALSLALLSSIDLKTEEKLLAKVLLALANLGFSRSQEREADKVGMEIALKSGFNPQGLLNFLNRLGRERVPPWTEYFASHPLPSHRLEICKRKLETISQEEWERIYLSLWERGEAMEARRFAQFQPQPPPLEESPPSPISREKLSALWERLYRIYPLSERISQWQSSFLLAPLPYELFPLIGEAIAQNDRLKELYAQALLLYNNVNILINKLEQKDEMEKALGGLISALDKGVKGGEKLLLCSASLVGLAFSKYSEELPLLSLQALLMASGRDIAKAKGEIQEVNNSLLLHQIEFLVHRLNSFDNEWLRRKCSHRLGTSLEGEMPLGDLCLLEGIAKTMGKPKIDIEKLWHQVSSVEEMLRVCNLTLREKEGLYIFLNSLAKGN